MTALPIDGHDADASQRPLVVISPPSSPSADTHWTPEGGESLPTTRASSISSADPSSDQPDSSNRARSTRTPSLADALLAIYADSLDDFERVRIATENRVRSLRQVKGMEGTKEEARLLGMTDALGKLEHDAELQLKRALRKHPLGSWIKATSGVGEKQGARLLAAIGDPAARRTVSQLWAYCGYHVIFPAGQERGETHAVIASGESSATNQCVRDHQRRFVGGNFASDTDQRHFGAQATDIGVAPSRKKGEQANWNPVAKSRAWLIAASCIKQTGDTANGVARPRSPYRDIYEQGRAKYADAIHNVDCPQCGVCASCGGQLDKNGPAHLERTGCDKRKGTAAVKGTPLTDGHKHARAMRLVAKEILKDLWIEARRVAMSRKDAE